MEQDKIREQILHEGYMAVAKTISGFGSDLKKVSTDVNDFKTDVRTHLSEINTKLDIFVDTLKGVQDKTESLEESRTEITTSFRNTKVIGGFILTLIAIIGSVGYYAYDGDKEQLILKVDAKITASEKARESEYQKTLENIYKVLGEKKLK